MKLEYRDSNKRTITYSTENFDVIVSKLTSNKGVPQDTHIKVEAKTDEGTLDCLYPKMLSELIQLLKAAKEKALELDQIPGLE